MLSEAVEDYLKAIYTIADGETPVSTSAIAARLGVALSVGDADAEEAGGDEAAAGDLQAPPRGPADSAGEKVALEVIRHHRLVELFLQEALGMSWDEVDREAERLEHVVSEALADRMAEKLGHPEFDPHGDPIPTKGGTMPAGEALMNLIQIPVGQACIVRRVCDDDSEVLRYVASLGIVPKARIILTEKAPFDGPIYVQVDSNGAAQVHALGQRVASHVHRAGGGGACSAALSRGGRSA